MLPVKSLDDQLFAEIVENARKRISKYYPQWTDYNAHDPGITFIELFAWLKELQQFHLDQIGPQNRLKFLKLFGLTPRAKKPARAFVRVYDVAADLALPQGTRLQAGEVQFETDGEEFITPGRIVDGFSFSRGQKVSFGNQLTATGGKMRFYLFGRAPEPGDAFYIGLDRPFPAGKTLSLYITIFDDYPVKRNRPEENFAPLAELKWEYYTTQGWREAQVEKDETFEFIQSGRICLKFAEEMAPLPEKSADAGEGYWLRATLLTSHYEVAPLMTGIGLNIIAVTQKKTLSAYHDFVWEEGIPDAGGGRTFIWDTELALWGRVELYVAAKIKKGRIFWRQTAHFTREIRDGKACFTLPPPGGEWQEAVRLVCYEEGFTLARRVGRGDGFPFQSFEVQTEDLLAADFQVMVAAAGGCFTTWEKVQDFDGSGPENRHYIIDENSGEITFGDCEQGLAPEGDILIISCATCAGQNGNVKEGRINAFARRQVAAQVMNDTVAAEGADQETVDSAFLRLRREIRRVERAVTYEDFENLVRSTPGLMIYNCKTIPVSHIPKRDGSMDENAVSIVVQPFASGGVRQLNAAYMENIQRQLRHRHLIGTRVNVLSPEYIGIQLFAEILTKPYYRDAEARIRQAVADFFGQAVWEFGRPVQYSSIYGIIDTLDCVVGVQSLVIDAQGKGITRSVSGDVMLPPNGMAYLKKAEYVISAGE
jgi:hypothetical protein